MARHYLNGHSETAATILARETVTRMDADYGTFCVEIDTETNEAYHLIFCKNSAFEAFSIAADEIGLDGLVVPVKSHEFVRDDAAD